MLYGVVTPATGTPSSEIAAPEGVELTAIVPVVTGVGVSVALKLVVWPAVMMTEVV
jgi:hypothetical protein